MDLGIAGRVAVVTGGARSIGRAVVEELVHEGTLEAGRDGITANAVYPGIVNTGAFELIRPDMQERIRHRIVWRAEAEPADIAKPIEFLCPEPARYITGTAWDLTGGIELFTF